MSRLARSASTIAAIASPPGGGLRGIVRLSGPRAREIVRAVFAGEPPLDLARRSVRAGRFRDARGEQPCLLLWMPGPRSFTREDVAEFHLPGSPPLLEAALARVLALGAAAAEPGEFTRRAFLSGRIDLTRAEGVLALVGARDERERRAGALLLAGGLSDRVDAARGRLEDLRALCEASLDFDERDTGHVPDAEIEAQLGGAREALREALAFEVARASPLGEPTVVLAGAPNAGKSSLLNLLAGEEAAIVSSLPGTTRDLLSASIDLECGLCRLVDTAGLAAGASGSGSAVEREARQRTEEALEAADLVVWVVDAQSGELGLPPRDAAFLLAWNKVDLEGVRAEPPPGLPPGTVWVATSAVTGAGIEDLRAAISDALLGRAAHESSGHSREIAQRHRRALSDAGQALDLARAARLALEPLEIQAEHLRAACEALDAITGATTPEDVLDLIFARFCLGK